MTFVPENKGQWICPVATPFDANGKIDFDSCYKLYDYLIAGGVDGIALPGSMGEFYNLSYADAVELVTKAIAHINGRTKVIVGAGRLVASEAVSLCNLAQEKGAYAALLVSPFYQALTQTEIIDYYSNIASQTPINIILYNIPSRTGYDINPQTIYALRKKHTNIWGVKDTLNGVDHTRVIIQLVKKEFPDFHVFSGIDDNFAHNLLSGGDGVIGGLANMFPKSTSAFVKAWNTGDWKALQQLQQVIDSMMPFYDCTPNLIVSVKTALQALGIIACDKTITFAAATPQQREKVVAFLKAQGLL